MIPTKIKFSNLVRSNSPLQKQRQMQHANDEQSLHNSIKYIPLSQKKDEQSDLLQTVLKGSEFKLNKIKISIHNGSLQVEKNQLGQQQQQQKGNLRSVSSRKKKGIRRGMKKETEELNNIYFSSQFDEDEDANVIKTNIQSGNIIYNQQNETLMQFNKTENGQLLKIANDYPNFCYKIYESHNNNTSSQPSTAATQTRQKSLRPSSPTPINFYQKYQIQQDSNSSIEQNQNEYYKKENTSQVIAFQKKISSHNSERFLKTEECYRQKSGMPAKQEYEQDKNKLQGEETGIIHVKQSSDNQIDVKTKLYKRSTKTKNKPQFPLIIQTDIPLPTPIKYPPDKNIAQFITKKCSLSSSSSPLNLNEKRKSKENLQNVKNYVHQQNERKIKQSCKSKKSNKLKSPTQQENTPIPKNQSEKERNLKISQQYIQFTPYLNNFNIQSNKIISIKANPQPPLSARERTLTPTQEYNPDSLNPTHFQLTSENTNIKNTLSIQNNKNINCINKKELNQQSNNQKQSIQNRNLQTNDESLFNLNSYNQFANKNQNYNNNSFPLQQQESQISIKERKINNDIISDINQYNLQSDSINCSASKELKNSLKIFYDLPPKYSDRIKFRKLQRIYFKPRPLFNQNNIIIIHFDGVLGIYDQPFFKHLKTSDPLLPHAQDNILKNDDNIYFQQTQGFGFGIDNQYNNHEQNTKQDQDDPSLFNEQQIKIIQNLKQSLNKISQWYFVILILPQKSNLWLQIKDHLVQNYFCDGIYTYDNQLYDYTESIYHHNIHNNNNNNNNNNYNNNNNEDDYNGNLEQGFAKNMEQRSLNQNMQINGKKNSKNDIMFANKTSTATIYRHIPDNFQTQFSKETNFCFKSNLLKESDSNNSSFNINNQSVLDLELLIDYNQIIIDLKMNQPKKVLLIDTLPLSMKECFTKIEDSISSSSSSSCPNEQKQDEHIHNIQFLRLKEKVWRTMQLKFPKIKCHKSALKVVFLPCLHYEQQKLSINSISFQSVLLEEIASEFKEDTSQNRYITRNRQRWFYLNLEDIFAELENQKLKECFVRHMKSGQTNHSEVKQPQSSQYKQEQEYQVTELTIKQKIHKSFSSNPRIIEQISKDTEKQAQNGELTLTNNNNGNNANNNNNNTSNKRQSLGFQHSLNNLIDNLVNKNSKIIKQFQQNKEAFQQGQQVQQIYQKFYDRSSYCTSKQQQQDKIEKELDLYIARKYKSSILFYFSNFQNSFQIILFLVFAFLL